MFFRSIPYLLLDGLFFRMKTHKKTIESKNSHFFLLYSPFAIYDRQKQILQQILMSCSEDSGPFLTSIEKEGEGQVVLIAGRFAFNHSPEIQLELILKTHALLINPAFPTKQSHPDSIPISPTLTYRITIPAPAGSQNSFWLLRLRNGKTEMTFRSVQFDSLERWSSLLKKHVYKSGFWEDYKAVRRISRGMGSAVFEVARMGDGARFAVKAFPKTQFQQNKNLLAGLQKEIRALREIKELKHRHLLGIEEVYDSNSSFYIVMELCGRDLYGGRKMEGHFRQEKTRQAMRQLLQGLAAMHDRGMVHRDIKPNNIMFRTDRRFELVITDYGMTMHLGEDHPFVQCGTAGFIAPEVFALSGNERLKDAACDIFSMGVVFHILLTAQPLFKADNQKELFQRNKSMDFNLNHQFYSNIDPVAMDLLKMMLSIDSKERITAKQALKHQYFSQQIKTRSPVLTMQTYNQIIQDNEVFSQIELETMGRKRHKGEYRKSSQQ